jgi:natural product precursor
MCGCRLWYTILSLDLYKGENEMKKKITKLTLNRETLGPLTSLEQEKLQEVLGGYWTHPPTSCTCAF